MLDAYTAPAVSGLCWGMLLFLVASGLNLAFGTGGVLNLAHGVQVAFGAYLMAAFSGPTWATFVLAVLAATAAGAAGGGLLAAAVHPIAGRGPLTQALLTAGLAMLGAQLITQLFGTSAPPTVLPAPIAGVFVLGGHVFPVYRLLLIPVAVILAVAGWWILDRTRAGRLVRATVDDRDMVAVLGINPRRVDTMTLIAAGAVAGLAGAIGAPVLVPGASTADTVLMLSLIIVVAGRAGSTLAALVAALVIGQVQSVGVIALPGLSSFLLFAGLIVVLLLRGPALTAHGGAR